MPFLDLTAGDLLDLFAAAKTTPGAGSAAALQGALAGSLIQSVAKYTLKAAVSPPDQTRVRLLLDGAGKVTDRLRRAVDEDSTAFARYWQSREEEDLWGAIDVPVSIAGDCVELGAMAIELYETGFRNARGESAAAALSALAAAEAALYAARLNLKLSKDSGRAALKIEAVRARVRQLRTFRERIEETILSL